MKMISLAAMGTLLLSGLSVNAEDAAVKLPSVQVTSFTQQVSSFYGAAQGLPSDETVSVALLPEDPSRMVVSTPSALARSSSGGKVNEKQWITDAVALKSVFHNGYIDTSGVVRTLAGAAVGKAPEGLKNPTALACSDTESYLSADSGLYAVKDGAFVVADSPLAALSVNGEVRAVTARPGCPVVVAAKAGLFEKVSGTWLRMTATDGNRSWEPVDVRGAAWAPDKNVLWFASPQGVGSFNADDRTWKLYTPEDGLPYDDFTCVAVGSDAVWFGTNSGAIRFDGTNWEYRQGKRWLPGDAVRDIAVTPTGDAWIATAQGLAVIEMRPMKLADKAAFYESEIDKYNRRTEYGFVIGAHLKDPNDKSTAETEDSDNDGLWTSMYGAGECYAYGATKSPQAKERAKKAFEALRFLQVVTQGGEHPAPKGFVARSILPTSGPDPNVHVPAEHDRKRQERDSLWKVLTPRWPVSADGKWYWKTDTSSDELDGHYFFYGLYYDLVADNEAEKARVREVVVNLTDHLIEHDFCLVDWDGKPTRWAVFSPKELNLNPFWAFERGMNSLSMLSYLAVAEHMTGDKKYRETADYLIREHGYMSNILLSKWQYGAGSMNQSDDEMAFMNYYNLLKYSKDDRLRGFAGFTFKWYWGIERPELNPFFNFIYASMCTGLSFTNQYSTSDLTPEDNVWLEQSVDTLKRIPLDLRNWGLKNSTRKDIVPLADVTREGGAQGNGHRRNGLVLPADERFFDHWSTDAWELDYRGNGTGLTDGTIYLLPYYMGLYHGFITE